MRWPWQRRKRKTHIRVPSVEGELRSPDHSPLAPPGAAETKDEMDAAREKFMRDHEGDESDG